MTTTNISPWKSRVRAAFDSGATMPRVRVGRARQKVSLRARTARGLHQPIGADEQRQTGKQTMTKDCNWPTAALSKVSFGPAGLDDGFRPRIRVPRPARLDPFRTFEATTASPGTGRPNMLQLERRLLANNLAVVSRPAMRGNLGVLDDELPSDCAISPRTTCQSPSCTTRSRCGSRAAASTSRSAVRRSRAAPRCAARRRARWRESPVGFRLRRPFR